MASFDVVKKYLFSILDQGNSKNAVKGKVFEYYCKWFLENDLGYSKQLKKVWLWDEWPGNWGRDKGIDLIAETHDGKIWAIQAKAYEETYYVTKDDVNTFLTESSRKIISFRLLIATTNNIGPNALETIKGQDEKPVAVINLTALENSELNWPASIDELFPAVKPKPHTPRPHQEKALQDILEGFTTSPIGQLYMACGTGKTLVGMWLAQRLRAQNILVLVPSISLVSQLYKEWSRHSGDFAFDAIFVCSDPTVGNKDDERDQIVSTVAELGFPTTTDSHEILQSLQTGSRPKIIFSTYHSSPVIAEVCGLNQNLVFDLVLADEAHRCAGAASSDFATIVNKDLIRAQRKLFMTATPKIYSEHVKKKTQEFEYEIVSMDDHEKFGPVFHKLSFSEAIKQDLLSDYQVIISVMDDTTYREYAERGRFVTYENHETDARTLASQLLIAKAIKKFELKRVITFHSRKKSAEDFADDFSEVIYMLSESERPSIAFFDAVFGDMNQSTRQQKIKKFNELENNTAGIIANVRCLSEGVDVPALDGIAFIDPKGSEIDIVQAVGRAIRKSENKKIGTIIIPIFMESTSDEVEMLDQSCFKVIGKVIRALRAHDEVLAEELDNIRLELGKRTYKKPPTLSKIVTDIPIGIGVQFSEALALRIIESGPKISLSDSHPEIAQQWHPNKNGELNPNNFTAGSNVKIWWKCPKGEDHEWQTTIGNRTYGFGCPACIGHLAVPSNCLAKTHPEIAQEWHPKKNGNLTPNNFTAGSGIKIWWKCVKGEDHEWQTTIDKRSVGNGCPVCANKIVVVSNCLNTTHPHLASEWHPTKNGAMTRYDIHSGYSKKVWWLCAKGEDHEWQASPAKRKQGTGCTVCAGTLVALSNCLATTHPALAKQWHPTKNGDLTAKYFTAGSNKKVWWKCPEGQDHEWLAAISKRTDGKGCPVCANRLVVFSNRLTTTHPDIGEQWHPTKNGDLRASDVTAGSHKKIWWKCPKGEGHEWQTSIYKRSYETGCPICSGKKVVLSNCLVTTSAQLAAQWHPTKNGLLTPYDVTAGSGKKIWWKCSAGDDHEWQATVRSRQTAGCPICSGRKAILSNCLATISPHLAAQWHPTKNGNLKPYDVKVGSHKKVWWKCSNNNDHEYEAVIRERSTGRKCSIC